MIPIIKRRRGISPVISTIILSAVVITIGGMIWSFAQGSSTIMASDYSNGTLELLNEITERFIVERVGNNTDGSILYIWIYNYGEVDVLADVYVDADSTSNYTLNIHLNASELSQLEIYFDPSLVSGDYVAIQVYSRRQNNAYYTYVIS